MNWQMPSWSEELGEFVRVSSSFDISMSSLSTMFQHGTLQDLDEGMWSILDNTDSREPATIEDVKHVTDQTGRNLDRILRAFDDSDGQLPAPIIIRLPDGKHHLVSGNTRLMVCRALGETPTVLMIGVTTS